MPILSNFPSGGMIDTIKKNGVAQPIVDRAVNIEVPTSLSELTADATHRTVTDTEKQTWNGKQDAIPANTFDAYGAAAAVQTNLDSVIAKIPSTASSTNKLVSASEMGDAIEAVEAKQLYATNAQGSFATKVALTSATTFYNADGSEATPTKNDVAYVLADESHDGKSAKYVIASVDPIVWGFVITFSDTTFSQSQMDAINSGATSAKISGYDSHVADTGIHVSSEQKTAWSGKQDAISDLATIRSGAASGATAVQPAALNNYVQTSDYNPTATTSAMTQAVGKDSSGKLWTSPATVSSVNGRTGNVVVKSESFSVNLPQNGWSGNAQTVSDSRFIVSGYAYTVAPEGASVAVYGSSGIYADDVTVAGKMTFHCNEVPSAALTVNILRTEANE